MSNIYKRAEFAANIAIIIVALLIGAALAYRYLIPSRPPSAQSQIQPGTRVTLPDVDWSKNGRTLLLVLQKGCHFCADSAPFYQRLVRETAGQEKVRLVAILPQEINEGRQYLNSLGVPIDDVRHSPIYSLGARVTPTLILVDDEGAVIDSWIGKLRADQENGVLSRLQAPWTARQ